MKETVVLFPSLGKGHLNPMVELAKLFACDNVSVTIVLVEPPFPSLSTTESFISCVSSAHPLISFHRLPKPEAPSSNMLSIFFEFFRQSNPLLLDFLRTLSLTSNIRALVLDMFCTAALDVANELRLPAFFFFCSSASSLATFLFVPTLQSELNVNLKDLGDKLLEIPGLPPIPASHIPDPPQDHKDKASKPVISPIERFLEADGIIINTFEELEPRAVQALVDDLCVPGRKMPSIYCIGPLTATNMNEGEKRYECLDWLDAQPKRSVVFLCFGSMGCFSIQQLREIAIGLERSGQRFLWVVRSPPSDDTKMLFDPRSEPDLSVLMPEGFLERTEGRGMVVKSWAPQTAVLAHESVGGFVSHCGWNSILEAVCAGVPMIAWPLFAEQKINKVILVEEAKLAVAMEGYDKELVRAEEVETKVRWLMQSEGGRELRNRAAAMMKSATAARKNGGSSDKAWMELMNVLRRH